jgi:putative transposase
MYERSTDSIKQKKGQEIHPTAEASDPQGMGAERQWYGRGRKVSDSSPYSLPLEKSPGTRRRDFPERQAAPRQSANQGIGAGESKAQGSAGYSDPRVDAVKKKDELGLANRPKGSRYSNVQRLRVIAEVKKLNARGINKTLALGILGVCRSTYYGWLKIKKPTQRKPSLKSLTDAERKAVIYKKKMQPQLSHRQISGYLRFDGFWVSPSSCYRILKGLNWVQSQQLRQAPWKVAHYEPFRPNMIWGEDWTILNIAGHRYYLLTIIDYFSRYIVAWGIVKSVTQREVRNLVALAYISEQIDVKAYKPMIRFDRGSPNMAHSTRTLIRDLALMLSPSRSHRPTDNARQERWYRTVKQEEIYCYPTYPTEQIARHLLAKYIDHYNEKRPHQSLCNFTPGYVHRLANKSLVYNHYKEQVQIAKEQRIKNNRSQIRQIQSVTN